MTPNPAQGRHPGKGMLLRLIEDLQGGLWSRAREHLRNGQRIDVELAKDLIAALDEGAVASPRSSEPDKTRARDGSCDNGRSRGRSNGRDRDGQRGARVEHASRKTRDSRSRSSSRDRRRRSRSRSRSRSPDRTQRRDGRRDTSQSWSPERTQRRDGRRGTHRSRSRSPECRRTWASTQMCVCTDMLLRLCEGVALRSINDVDRVTHCCAACAIAVWSAT